MDRVVDAPPRDAVLSGLPVNDDTGRAIIRVCRRLHRMGWVAAGDGNVSVRIGSDRMRITPTGHYKTSVREVDLAEMSLAGAVLSGQPSSEFPLHLAIYQRCEKARAVVHAHPPIATAWSIARPDWTELPIGCVAEVILGAGSIPFAPYARPGTPDVAAAVEPYLPDHRVLVLSRHGALAWGESLEEAYAGIDRLEHSAHLLATAQLLGSLSDLPPHEIEALRVMRGAKGPRIL